MDQVKWREEGCRYRTEQDGRYRTGAFFSSTRSIRFSSRAETRQGTQASKQASKQAWEDKRTRGKEGQKMDQHLSPRNGMAGGPVDGATMPWTRLFFFPATFFACSNYHPCRPGHDTQARKIAKT
ncbi:hypothetical protein EAE96_008598 [Botrytis aclada]|nr:hypothetical protein EAE96_008598 [Botrytis aclada]